VDEEERSRWGFKFVGAEVDVMGCKGADEDVERTIHPGRDTGCRYFSAGRDAGTATGET
jgi:hypothetical protein